VYYPGREGVTRTGIRGPSKEVIQASKAVAERFYQGMVSSLSGVFSSNGLKTDAATAIGARQGALTGSIFSQTPTVLVEMVVLTNPSDEQWIDSSDGFHAMVEALWKGVLASVPKRKL
jgi:N-acetylmuramoyl-L-alanine amidase